MVWFQVPKRRCGESRIETFDTGFLLPADTVATYDPIQQGLKPERRRVVAIRKASN